MSRRNRERAAQEAASQATQQASLLQQSEQSSATEPQAGDAPEYVAPVERDPAARPAPRNEPRRLAMEEIENRQLRQMGLDKEPEIEQEAPQEKAVAKEQQPEPVQEEPKTEEPVAAEQPPAEPEPVKTVRVKVDGEEFDAPEDEVNEYGGVKAYQMHKAAENRLKKANEALAETRRMQAQLAEAAQRQAQAATPQKSPDQLLAEKVDIIRYGTPEESAAALKEVLEYQRVDPNAIISQAVHEMNRQAAESAFVQEFSDVVHNPLLLKLIINEKNERIAASIKNRQPITDWQNFYRSIGNEVRGAVGRQSQPASVATSKTTDSTSTAPSDKEARKASIVNLPTAAARAALPEADKPETREDILLQMKKARGIPTG